MVNLVIFETLKQTIDFVDDHSRFVLRDTEPMEENGDYINACYITVSNVIESLNLYFNSYCTRPLMIILATKILRFLYRGIRSHCDN